MVSLEDVAGLGRELISKAHRRFETELVDLLCWIVFIESGNPESWPPALGSVTLEDAALFRDARDSFPDGPAALLVPTLQEDYGFPSENTFPYVEPDVRPWTGRTVVDVEKAAVELVTAINSLRSPSDPPCVLVDLDASPVKYVELLESEDRAKLRAYGLE